MSARSRLPAQDPRDIPEELVKLGQVISQVTGPQRLALEAAYREVVEQAQRRRRILSLVQEALSQLRLDIKYLMFDLEVTRRERDALRHQLEE
ncbi:MAG: transcriptional regulator [Planctomycetaceae bacterium]|nr:MAG: transcriptional regulator [Planctomycetaceae bacterium]